MTLTVTLLGGESTGKSTLAQALYQHLTQVSGLRTLLVGEHLRDWCVQQGRAPRAVEQAALADAQSRRIAQATAQRGVEVVVADTTALVVAAYSAHYFQDHSLFARALLAQQGYGLSLVMGLDLPWQADGLFRESPAVRDAIDARLRHELQAAGLPFQTVYGQGQTRLHQALRAIGRRLGRTLVAEDPRAEAGRRPWNCDTCSDPGCEHRLFTRLLQDPR
jgi:HTH-type transcriptional repressor of NAD biosynthesis genes